MCYLWDALSIPVAERLQGAESKAFPDDEGGKCRTARPIFCHPPWREYQEGRKEIIPPRQKTTRLQKEKAAPYQKIIQLRSDITGPHPEMLAPHEKMAAPHSEMAPPHQNAVGNSRNMISECGYIISF